MNTVDTKYDIERGGKPCSKFCSKCGAEFKIVVPELLFFANPGEELYMCCPHCKEECAYAHIISTN